MDTGLWARLRAGLREGTFVGIRVVVVIASVAGVFVCFGPFFDSRFPSGEAAAACSASDPSKEEISNSLADGATWRLAGTLAEGLEFLGCFLGMLNDD